MIAIVLIFLMVVAIVTTELIMRCSPEGKESVESSVQMAGD